jgi:hypothetical protein
MHLASEAWLTDQIRCSFDIKAHPIHQISLNQYFHISEVVVGKSVISIVLIDGGDEEWWFTRVSKGHMGCIDMHNET